MPPLPPPQFHFPWKLTGEISFDDIAAAGGPPDQWDALPTNAKLQIILFIGPRILRRRVMSTATLVARNRCSKNKIYLLQSKMMTKRSGSQDEDMDRRSILQMYLLRHFEFVLSVVEFVQVEVAVRVFPMRWIGFHDSME